MVSGSHLRCVGALFWIRAAADGLLAGLFCVQVGYFARLQRLIEDAVADKGEPCIIVAHSMGGLVSHYFLTKVPRHPAAIEAADWLFSNAQFAALHSRSSKARFMHAT